MGDDSNTQIGATDTDLDTFTADRTDIKAACPSATSQQVTNCSLSVPRVSPLRSF